MPLDAESLAELVVQTVDLALAPVLERLTATEARLQVYAELATKQVRPAPPDPELSADDIAASVTGLLTKELATVETPVPAKTRKVIERSASGFVVTEERV